MRKYASKLNKAFQALRSKKIVFIVCSMRSGSTLLKSLLSNLPDASHLPETDFQKYTAKNVWKLKTLSNKKVIVLKKPSTFEDLDYPKIPPIRNAKIIILVRDVYDTVTSLKKMNETAYPHLDKEWSYAKLVNYWCLVYKNILATFDPKHQDVFLVKYEDLTAQPKVVTKKLFTFLGYSAQNGVDTYLSPPKYNWEWGNDDGGLKIGTLKVQSTQYPQNNQKLWRAINNHSDVPTLRKVLGYN